MASFLCRRNAKRSSRFPRSGLLPVADSADGEAATPAPIAPGAGAAANPVPSLNDCRSEAKSHMLMPQTCGVLPQDGRLWAGAFAALSLVNSDARDGEMCLPQGEKRTCFFFLWAAGDRPTRLSLFLTAPRVPVVVVDAGPVDG